MPDRKLRLLGLHGFRTSGHVFRRQMEHSGLLASLSDLIEVTFVDAPHVSRGPLDPRIAEFSDGGRCYEWWDTTSGGVGSNPIRYVGWRRSAELLSDYCKLHGPFDGLIGFSQGAAMATVLVGMQEQGVLWEDLPRMRLCVAIGGFVSRDLEHSDAFCSSIECPAVIMVGDKDFLRMGTLALVDRFARPVVVYHPGGHKVPSLEGEDLEKVKTLLLSVLQSDAQVPCHL